MLSYTLDRTGRTNTVRLDGELDLAVVQELRDVLGKVVGDGRSDVVVVDLGGVTFVDSVVIGVLVGQRQAAERAGRCLYVAEATGRVRDVLAVTGVLDYLTAPRPAGLDSTSQPSPRDVA